MDNALRTGYCRKHNLYYSNDNYRCPEIQFIIMNVAFWVWVYILWIVLN